MVTISILHLCLVLQFQFKSSQAWNPIRNSYSTTSQDVKVIEEVSNQSSGEVEHLLNSMQQRASSLVDGIPSITPSNPSCFFLALSHLLSSTPCETLSRSDTSRVETATSMALCEIKTGNGKVPRECQEWQESRNDQSGKEVIKVGVCVEALARSPQSWSSYSGYLREVVTVCSSYRRWADLGKVTKPTLFEYTNVYLELPETAKQLHSESATNFQDFVEMLRNYETARQLREYDEGIAKDNILKHLTSLSNELNLFTGSLTVQQIQHSEEVEILRNNLLTSLQSFDQHLLSSLDRELGTVMSSMMRQGDDLRELLEKSLSGLTDQLRKELSLASTDLDLQLKNSLDIFQPSLRLVVDQLEGLHESIELNSGLVDTTNKVLSSMAVNGDDIVQSLSNSLDMARELLIVQAATLEAHRDQVSNLTEKIEILTQAEYNFGLRTLLRSMTLNNMWWWSAIFGYLRNGFGFRSLFFTILSSLASNFHPYIAHTIAIVGVLTTIYPAFTFLFKLFKFLSKYRQPLFLPRIPRIPQLQLEAPLIIPQLKPNQTFRRIEIGPRTATKRRNSRIPSQFWMEED